MSGDNELHRVLGTISSDVKHILLRQDKQDAALDRMRERVTVVERFQWKLAGGMAAAMTGMTAFMKYFY
jgi:hypothetical protein